MSTAEAVSTGYAAGIHAYYYGAGEPQAEHVVQHLVGTALKDAPDDISGCGTTSTTRRRASAENLKRVMEGAWYAGTGRQLAWSCCSRCGTTPTAAAWWRELIRSRNRQRC